MMLEYATAASVAFPDIGSLFGPILSGDFSNWGAGQYTLLAVVVAGAITFVLKRS